MALVEAKMSDFVARETGLSHEDAYQLQKRYLNDRHRNRAWVRDHPRSPRVHSDRQPQP